MVQRARPVGPGSRRSSDRTTQQGGRSRRPWQRPAQLQHGARAGASEDMEATGALLARMAAVRAWVSRPVPPMWRRARVFAAGNVPFQAAWAEDAAGAYLRLLDQVLADRVITDAEVRRLRETASAWGIGALEVESLHRGYVARVWEEALADERITAAERDDITLLARLLGTPLPPLRDDRPGATRRWVTIKVESGTEEQDASHQPGWAVRSRAHSVGPPASGSRKSTRARSGGSGR